MCHSPTTDTPFYSKFHVNIDWQKKSTRSHIAGEKLFVIFQNFRGAAKIDLETAPT